MLIPCIKGENECFPCEGDSSNPLANLSSEAPDTNIWTSVQFRRVVNVIPNTWRRDTCVGFCESSVSQLDADDCAARRALECIEEPPLPPIPPEPPGNPPLVFCNQEITAQSGSSCYTIPACTVFASSQAAANAIAQSMADSRVLNPALSSFCAPIVPPPGPTPEPPPVLPCDACCNCGAIVQIENYTPELFTFDPALLDVNDSTSDCNTPPQSETMNLSGKAVVPDEGWAFCTGLGPTANFFFFKQFGSWFRMDSAGWCINPVDARVITSPLEAYPLGEPFDGEVILKHYPYDLGFGTGAWNGQFALTDASFNTCAIQNFPTAHINGLGGFITQLDQSGSGPGAVWTLTIKKYYSTVTEFTCSIIPLDDWWVGQHTGESQCGTYSKTGGELFTGPASLNIVSVP